MHSTRYVFIFIFLCFLSSDALADYRKVKLKVGGREIAASQTAVFDGRRVLAPVSALRALGINHTASADGKTINVIGERSADSDFALAEIEGTVMVPITDVLRFVGGDIALDESKGVASIRGRVTSVGFSDGLLTVNCSIPLSCSVSHWNGRLIVDVSGARLATEAKEIYVGEAVVDKIRLGQYTDDTARVVLDLARPAGYKIEGSLPASRISVRVGEDLAIVVPRQTNPDSSAQPFSISAIQIEKLDDSRFDLVMETDRRGTVSVSKSYFPSEITLILKGATYADSVKGVSGDHSLLVNTRFVQASTSPPLARVHMNLMRPVLSSARIDERSIRVGVRLPDKAGGRLEDRLVVIDPGHGGAQPGAVAGDVKEKDVNLKLAAALVSALNNAGVRTLLTRSTDVTMDLTPRSAFAIENAADFFISLHCNSNLKPDSKSGVETYFYRDGESGPILARAVQKGICSATGMSDGGARDCGFKVLRMLDGTGIPGVLVECGYLNHSGDRTKLQTEDHRRKLAQGIVAGLKAYVEGTPL